MPTRSRARAVLAFIVTLWGFLPVTGLAQGPLAPSPEARKQASTHFHRAVSLFEEEAFRAALIEFERAYAIAPDYRLLYNIGRTYIELHDYLHAIQSYERYLADGREGVPAESREQVERDLISLAERVGRLSIHANRDAAEVYVDEQQVGITPLAATVAVNVGRHRVFARAKDGATGETAVDVAGGDLVDVTVELVAPLVTQAPAANTAVAQRRSLSTMRWLAISSWALAVPTIATAVATGVMAGGKADDFDSALSVKPATDASKKKVSDSKDAAHKLALTSDVMTGVSVALAVTGLLLWLRGDDKPKDVESKAVSWGVGFGSAHLEGRF